jgi:hypothetical protein
MTSFGDSPADWLDDELRRVSLPEGMLDRLRALAALSDDKLDAVLRGVPLPQGMMGRLKELAQVQGSGGASRRATSPKLALMDAAIDDATLDLALRDVTVPAGLEARLSEIAINRAKPLPEERLREVPLPDGFIERLERTAWWACLTDSEFDAPEEPVTAPRRSLVSWLQGMRPAAKAGILAASAASCLLAVFLVFRSGVGSSGPGGAAIVGNGNVGNGNNEQRAADIKAALKAVNPPTTALVVKPLPPAPAATSLAENPPEFPQETPDWELNEPIGPTEADLLGSNPGSLQQPKRIDAPVAKGQIPAWRDFNADLLLFLLANRVNPAVTLTPTMHVSADASLLACRVPTVTSTDSFDSAWTILERRRPSGSQFNAALKWLQAEVRPEEFLAAIKYSFSPAVPGTLALRTAGGVSPFGSARQRLLQVALTAGEPLKQGDARQTSKFAAEDVQLVVTFNPHTVAAYRLIGHEATSVLGVNPAVAKTTLNAGETSTGLFEVELRGGGDELVATVELTWRKPGESEVQRETRRVSRWQLADSLLETPASVQGAAVAAETAEILRRSHFAAGREHSWARIRQVAAEVHPDLAAEPTFRRLLELGDRAQQWGIR